MNVRIVRFGGLLTCLLGLVAQAQSGSSNATASGRVKGAEGPIVVYLQANDDNPTRYYDGYKVDAEKDGAFRFEDVRPGTYRVWATASGFMTASPDTTQVVLKAGEKRTGFTLEMVRRRALCGRVTENGEPKTTWVDAYRYDPEFDSLKSVFLPNTDKDGSYRFTDLEPGTYYLQGYTTWYPGSRDFTHAQAVAVGPDSGPPKCDLDIPLQYTGCMSKKVTGRIAASSSLAGEQFHVVFLERNSAGGAEPTLIAMNVNDVYQPGDSFSATVCPGQYQVLLTNLYGAGPWREPARNKVIFDSQDITVDGNADGVVLTPRPMGKIAGEVHFEGIEPRQSCPGLGGQEVRVLREGDGQAQSVRLDDKNRFEMKNVAPGEYSVFLGPYRRESVYVKSIVVNGKAIEGRRFSIPQPEETRIEITLSADLANAAGHLAPETRTDQRWEVAWTRPKGSVSGKVTGNDSGGYDVKLVSSRFNSGTSQQYSTHTSADGSFHFENVDPGTYTLRAARKGWVTSEFGAREPGKQGSPIVVGRGERVQGLKLAPPQATRVCGQVTNASGVPEGGLRIFVASLDMSIDTRLDQTPILTDSDGRFRTENLPPAQYYLSFSTGGEFAYFSSDGSLSTATPIQLVAGKDIGCKSNQPLQLRMPAQVSPRHSISGSVVGDLPKKVGDRFWVNLLWDKEARTDQGYVSSGKLDADHKFQIDRVPNGKFVMELHSAYGPEPMTWSGMCGPRSHLLATQKIEMHDGDVRDVQITPGTLPSVRGAVHFEELPKDWTGFRVNAESITLTGKDYCAGSSARLDDNGGYSIEIVDAGEYEVGLQQLSHPLYVRELRLNGRLVKGRHVRLQPGDDAKLEVFVSSKGGEATASVVPDPKLPRAEPWAKETCSGVLWPQYDFLLLPDPLEQAGERDPLQELAIQGHAVGDIEHPTVQAGSIPPGRYRALVAEHLFQPTLFANGYSESSLRLFRAIAALGESVTVAPGAKIEIKLTDRTVDVEREAAKLGLPLDRNALDVP